MRSPMFFLLLMITGCGNESVSNLRDIPLARYEYWESFSPTCNGYPSKENCDDGDMALFGGLLCASGDPRGCRLVQDSQSVDGRFWRSPRRNPGNLGERKSFSRDQANGVMLYLIATHNQNAALSWLQWIESNRPCLINNPMGGCLIYGPHRFCTDEENQMCTLTPATWAVLDRVFEFLDLPKNNEMRRFRGWDNEILIAEAQNAPLGYETHLPAVEVLLKRQMQVTPEYLDRASAILHHRQPENLFFSYLYSGWSQEIESKLLELCPSGSEPTDFSKRQWTWERDTVESAWEESMGWDCLFLANLLKTSKRT